MKSGFAALVGRPNAGKSTLMNHLIGQKIAITSGKPQTTRNRIRTVYTDSRGQIVFLDTPGLTQARNRLGEYMIDVAESTMKDADLILWITDAGEYAGASERHIAEELKKTGKPVVLVLNKTDLLKDPAAAETAEKKFRELGTFAAVVPVSALKDRNTDGLLSVLFGLLPEGPLYYDAETVTDQTMREIAGEMVREQALRLLKDEIPHGIAVTVERMKERREGLTDIDATIVCERESHKAIIIGRGGSMLKKIGTGARKAIEDMTETQINLKLFVKVRKDWRDDESQMKNLGYELRKGQE